MRVTRYDELGSIGAMGAIVMDRKRPIALELRAQYTLLQFTVLSTRYKNFFKLP